MLTQAKPNPWKVLTQAWSIFGQGSNHQVSAQRETLICVAAQDSGWLVVKERVDYPFFAWYRGGESFAILAASPFNFKEQIKA